MMMIMMMMMMMMMMTIVMMTRIKGMMMIMVMIKMMMTIVMMRMKMMMMMMRMMIKMMIMIIMTTKSIKNCAFSIRSFSLPLKIPLESKNLSEKEKNKVRACPYYFSNLPRVTGCDPKR